MTSSARSGTLRVKREPSTQQPSALHRADAMISIRIATGRGARR
jgi:hypothetical protein